MYDPFRFVWKFSLKSLHKTHCFHPQAFDIPRYLITHLRRTFFRKVNKKRNWCHFNFECISGTCLNFKIQKRCDKHVLDAMFFIKLLFIVFSVFICVARMVNDLSSLMFLILFLFRSQFIWWSESILKRKVKSQ